MSLFSFHPTIVFLLPPPSPPRKRDAGGIMAFLLLVVVALFSALNQVLWEETDKVAEEKREEGQ